ncbi:MAG: ATP-binding protein [Candidatus Sulfotelmatobacter sp.]
MASAHSNLFVRSHVSRDLLQNAALFRTDKLVVWEYVSNGLQYVDIGTSPTVKVTLDSKQKKITVSDNGRGMDWSAIQNFFVMHGENVDRNLGHPGRGRFGTGKSAAFGIADVLRLKTVRNGKRSCVQLNRKDVEHMKSDAPIPVEIIERETQTPENNGTLIEIENIHLKSLDQAGIIQYIERHLARWPKNSSVFVNNHECEFSDPPVSSEKRFKPVGILADRLGDVDLIVKVSMTPLDPPDLRGVSIYSNGVWHETTLAGSEGREMSQYIFGEIDIPKLDADSSPISPFDLSRSMRLNPSNELVQVIYGFIGQSVEDVRRELVARDKDRRATEESKRLAEHAAEIARIINEDFDAFRQRVEKVKARAVGSLDSYPKPVGPEEEDLVFGDEVPAEAKDNPYPGENQSGGSGSEASSSPNPNVTARPDAEKRGRAVGGSNNVRRRSGGFQVQFKQMGSESHRAQYFSAERTIYINLDHPQLVAAKGTGTIDDPLFRRLAIEVAFAEYSVALASELAARGEYMDFSDPIFVIRETLNRIARRGASLYS